MRKLVIKDLCQSFLLSDITKYFSFFGLDCYGRLTGEYRRDVPFQITRTKPAKMIEARVYPFSCKENLNRYTI